MPDSLQILPPNTGKLIGSPVLPASKSESNRALMIQRYSGGSIRIENLSNARDTETLFNLLHQTGTDYDAKDAGTTFRFLTSMLAIEGRQATLTGSERMKQRPIGILVSALQDLGCGISYLEKEGYPPLSFGKFHWSGKSDVSIDASVSSQFISSLMMAAPLLPDGLSIRLSSSVSSLPYLKMTWALMKDCGIEGSFNESVISIPPQSYSSTTVHIESDWSAASYWFGLAALAEHGTDLFLAGLKPESLQGDSYINQIGTLWGVSTEFSETGLRLRREPGKFPPTHLELDFNGFPDLAQTVIVLCVLSGTEGKFTGLQSLAIKETNRLLALKTELAKLSLYIQIDETAGLCWFPGKQQINPQAGFSFETYDDHRMAMALSLVSLAIPVPVLMKDPQVVQKSYPDFWRELSACGFRISKG